MSGIRRYPIAAYFVLAFVISWGGILLATVPSGFPGDKEDMGLFVLVFASMAAGPSIAGIVMTAVMEGRTGLRELLARVTRWRVPLRWYAVALLTAPVLLAVIFGLLSLVSPVSRPPTGSGCSSTLVWAASPQGSSRRSAGPDSPRRGCCGGRLSS